MTKVTFTEDAKYGDIGGVVYAKKGDTKDIKTEYVAESLVKSGVCWYSGKTPEKDEAPKVKEYAPTVIEKEKEKKPKSKRGGKAKK